MSSFTLAGARSREGGEPGGAGGFQGSSGRGSEEAGVGQDGVGRTGEPRALGHLSTGQGAVSGAGERPREDLKPGADSWRLASQVRLKSWNGNPSH